MDIATVREMKKKLEIEINKAVRSLTSEFQESTGVMISSVSLDVWAPTFVNGKNKSYISECRVQLEI